VEVPAYALSIGKKLLSPIKKLIHSCLTDPAVRGCSISRLEYQQFINTAMVYAKIIRRNTSS